jgi:hypothetical protein
MTEPTDLDLVTDHPYRPGRWGDVCVHVHENGWTCGYSRAEHERLKGAPADGEEPDRAAEFERSQRARLEGAKAKGGEA